MYDGMATGPRARWSWIPLLGAVITAGALLLQFVLFQLKGPELGLGAIASAAKFLTFMTNLTGIGVLAVFLAALDRGTSRWARWLRDPAVQGAVLVYAALVGLVYHFLLAGTWRPAPLWWTAAFMLHYLMPACYLSYWLLCEPGGRLRWIHVLWWQVFPVSYVVAIMLIGARMAGYPYPFLDVGVVGWSGALGTMAAVLAGYIGLSALVVAADRLRGGTAGLRARTS